MSDTEKPLEVEARNSAAEENYQQQAAELEKRVNERTEQLAATNRELESFTYSVSHDLRSPLRPILGYANILLEDYSDVLDEEGQKMLQRQVEAAHRMERLIADLLEYSRVGRHELVRAEFDLSRLARDIGEEITRRSWSFDVQFHIQDGMRAYADPGLLRFVLQNLFENAVKYSAPKGVAHVSMGETPEGAFYVRDQGIGFDMSYAHKLFKPFERLHSATDFPGTGIGLANVQRVVQRHGGKVWAAGAVNEGATFYFTLA